jgi:glyoxylase-like metal-dependent hydrolase (beta-lactamase superfamily II)/ferredoxin
MASPKRRLATNVAGDFFVDETCIDCETCRWMAPATFNKQDSQSRVYWQPVTEEERRRALLALISCPTGSIGTTEKHDIPGAKAALPDRIDGSPKGDVYHCGYHAESSFGAASYLIVRPQGNVLVDSPRWAGALVHRLEELGGVRWMFLTHQDDVADHRKYRDHFACERVMHQADLGHGTRDIERPIVGEEPVLLDVAAADGGANAGGGAGGAGGPGAAETASLLVIPTPGHTRGSACLLFADRYLFTGDHLAWSHKRGHLYAFRSACWYDWDAQIASMDRLHTLQQQHPFEWVLPGHGRRWHGAAEEMREQLRVCAQWMRTAR